MRRRACKAPADLLRWSAILARVHHLRGEPAEAVRHLRATLTLVRAARPKVPAEELPGYEAWLEKLEGRLREYEAPLRRR